MNEAHRFRATPRRRPLAVLLAAAFAAAGFAATAAAMQLPSPQHQGKITYISGGVGSDDAKAMREAAAKYPLEVEFIKKEAKGPADYLAGDRLTISDHARKTVLDTTSAGPYLLAKLPPGHYTVSAWNQGKEKTRGIDITAKKHAHVVFEW